MESITHYFYTILSTIVISAPKEKILEKSLDDTKLI